jgi:orotate phosphoribosyltransferase
MSQKRIDQDDIKESFLSQCLDAGVFKFGSFTLKSGRVSPYFINTGLFYTGSLVHTVAIAYANALVKTFPSGVDIIFGPAYKGIPLAAITVVELMHIDKDRYQHIAYSFNRKEVKAHGEGGNIVGSPLKGKRVVIVDDVITAGTALREAIQIIEAEGGKLSGILVAFDRQEITSDEEGGDGPLSMSTIAKLQKEYNVPACALLTLEDLWTRVKCVGSPDQIENFLKYRKSFGAGGIGREF